MSKNYQPSYLNKYYLGSQDQRKGTSVTRLVAKDLESIPLDLGEYDQSLINKTTQTLLGIACHSYKVSETDVSAAASSVTIWVVPVTAGLGIISTFTETVCHILRHLGFSVQLSPQSDTSGIAMAVEQGADALFIADDHRFIALDLHNRKVVDNSVATGRVFSGALELMAGDVRNKDVLVLGCGPVGRAACKYLLKCGARVGLYDLHKQVAAEVKKTFPTEATITLENDLTIALGNYRLFIDATPAEGIIDRATLKKDCFISAPGVPLGVSGHTHDFADNQLIHDKLELGVAAMAVALVCSINNWKYLD